jgi:hypothetical protein
MGIKVKIQVKGGVAEVVECPQDVDVEIEDLDGQDEPETGDGKAVWEKDHPPLSAEVVAARAGILPHDPQDDEPEGEHDPVTCGCAYMGNDCWSCGHIDNDTISNLRPQEAE